MLDLSHCRHLLVYGGTFDPPHRAHVDLPAHAMAAVGAEGVLYIPARQPPHKPGRVVQPAVDRLAMLRLALADVPHAGICDWELHQPGPSYTVRTLEHLRQTLPADCRLRLLIGADMAAIFPQWREPERIMELAEPLVMLRPPHDVEGLLATIASAGRLSDPQVAAWRNRIVSIPTLDISSTELRSLLAAGRFDDPRVTQGLHPAVLDYIRGRGLYRLDAADNG